MNPSWIAGVDGFRCKWFVVLVNHAQGRVKKTRHQICDSFEEVLNLTPAPKVIAIDIDPLISRTLTIDSPSTPV